MAGCLASSGGHNSSHASGLFLRPVLPHVTPSLFLVADGASRCYVQLTTVKIPHRRHGSRASAGRFPCPGRTLNTEVIPSRNREVRWPCGNDQGSTAAYASWLCFSFY